MKLFLPLLFLKHEARKQQIESKINDYWALPVLLKKNYASNGEEKRKAEFKKNNYFLSHNNSPYGCGSMWNLVLLGFLMTRSGKRFLTSLISAAPLRFINYCAHTTFRSLLIENIY